jgi:large subunit ribosomal protein L2
MPLSKINIGQEIFCIETVPNSGPKLCRTSGSSALLVSKGEKDCIIQMPSKKTKRLDLRCRATVGTPAGDGRLEKPWVKAGKKWHAMHARGKLYPRTSASKMNAIDHPFGGHAKLGRPKTISRHAPPGRKTGSIAARRTGKKKR